MTSWARAVLALVGVLVGLLSIAAGTAHALVTDEATLKARAERLASPEHRDKVRGLLRRGSAAAAPRGTSVATSKVVSDLWLSEHRPMPNQVSSNAMHRELRRMRTKAGLVKSFKAFGTVGMGLTAFQAGFKIGGGLTQLWEAPVVPATAPSWSTTATAVDKGQLLAGAVEPGLTEVRAPEDGWYFGVLNWTEAPAQHCSRPKPGPPPGGAENGIEQTSQVTSGRECLGDAPTYPLLGYRIEKRVIGFMPAEYVPKPKRGITSGLRGNVSDPAPEQAPTNSPNRVVPEPYLPGGEDARTTEDAAIDEMATSPSQYPTLINWLDSETGGTASNPLRYYMPSCVGVGYVTCSERIRTALGDDVVTIDRRQAPNSAITPTTSPNEVITTEPEVGYELVPNQTVVVYAAPAQLDVEVPQLAPGTVATEYGDTLTRLGLTPKYQDAPAGEYAAGTAPGTGLSTDPPAGTRVRLGSEVTVRRVSPTAPFTSPAGGPCGLTPPTASWDTAPLTELRAGDRMPFALVGFLRDSVGGVAGAGSRPSLEFSAFGATVGTGFLVNFETPISYLRLVLAFLLWIGAAWFVYGRTIGKGA